MISRVPFTGGWYGDTNFFRDSAVLYRDLGIKINGIDYSLPIYNGKYENALYLTSYRRGGDFYLAGQGNQSGNVVIFINGKWISLGPCFGTRQLAFYGDLLYIVRSGNSVDVYSIDDFSKPIQTIQQQIGVNGIQFINDGVITSGDSVYNGSNLPVKLAQYTVLPGNPPVTIGQSYVNGCVAVFTIGNKTYRSTVEAGDCQFIRAYRNANQFAIYIVKMLEVQAVVIYCDFDWLMSQPQEGNVPIPVPDPIPGPVMNDVLHPDSDVVPIGNLWSAIDTVRRALDCSDLNSYWEWHVLEKTNLNDWKYWVGFLRDKAEGNGKGYKTADVLTTFPFNTNFFDGKVPGYPYPGVIPVPVPPTPTPSKYTVDGLIHQVLPAILTQYNKKYDNDPSFEGLTFQLGRLLVENWKLEDVIAQI